MVEGQWQADPDLVEVGAEQLGVKLAELGPVPKDPHMGLLRDLARTVLEAVADEVREAGMVADRRAAVLEAAKRTGRHPNEQPGARLDPQQQALVKAGLADLREWVRSGITLGRDVGRQGAAVASLEAVEQEITRRLENPHVGVHLSAVLRG